MAILKQIKINPIFTYSFFVSLAGLLLGLVAQFILPPEVPLLYGLPQTDSQLISPIWIVLPSSLALVITTLNSLLALKFNDSYLKKTLGIASLACSILAIVTTLKIIFLVGSI